MLRTARLTTLYLSQFNEVNSRRLDWRFNIFSGIFSNPIFLGVLTVTLALQVIARNPTRTLREPYENPSPLSTAVGDAPERSVKPCVTKELLCRCRLQIIITQTPLSVVFKVSPQNWQEWVFAIAVGAGSMVMCVVGKVAARSGEAAHPLARVETDRSPASPWGA